MWLLACSVRLDSLHELHGGLLLRSHFFLLTIRQMFNGGEFALNRTLYLLKLAKVDVQLTIIEMALFHWLANLLEFLQFLGIFLLRCSLSCLIKPFYHLIYLLKEGFPLWLRKIFFERSIRIEIRPHLVGISL